MKDGKKLSMRQCPSNNVMSFFPNEDVSQGRLVLVKDDMIDFTFDFVDYLSHDHACSSFLHFE